MPIPIQLSGTALTPRITSKAPLLKRLRTGGGDGTFEISFTRMTSRCAQGGPDGHSAAATELASGSAVFTHSLLTLIPAARNQTHSRVFQHESIGISFAV